VGFAREATVKESRSVWKWVIVGLVIAMLVPVVVVVLGVLWVTPVRVQREPAADLGPTIVVVEQGGEVALHEGTLPPGTSEEEPAPEADQPMAVAESPTGGANGSAGLSLNPNNATLYVLLPALAGLAVLACALIVSLLAARWKSTETSMENGMLDGAEGADASPWPRVRYVVLGTALWIGLSLFLLLDLWSAVSLFVQFVVIYASFWVLVGLLLLIGRTWKEKLLILGLFVAVLVSVRFVDWNSRKPFLKDLGRIEEGMTVSQVDQIMAGYERGPEADGPPVLEQAVDSSTTTDQAGRTWVTYRHTAEGWGNSDWGVVGFQDGVVFETRFLPD
jgi:hypothetical protein